MNDSRPALQEGLSVADFRRFYWRKDELTPFCRKASISTVGSKAKLQSRVKKYLDTGVAERPRAKSPARRSRSRTRAEEQAQQCPDTPIPPDYTNSKAGQAFLESVIDPQFHFTILGSRVEKARHHPVHELLQEKPGGNIRECSQRMVCRAGRKEIWPEGPAYISGVRA